ncbi:DNA adenine methylase [Magnetococcus marinus MC-1]|uniref:Site-specific DNA-methyltransferase (adenine-specific) n=1 Tax=Magnetococcus marinus (strain ATCC BAA-1437 / JCM 17883 / MC-1) TaxID=156889 RepID=A0L749_MAGMM|nr:Dam family site-specific DNA-(adenine-N6)-methyltransferase [Magnetococcus marinus]ABK43792.1 DNA adenine methylase [Magnetococcus marinus MC-1]
MRPQKSNQTLINMHPKPFIKWAGGKQALAQKLIDYFPEKFNVYYEPFLGGGSVFFYIRPKSALLSDYNEWLVNTFQAIQKNWVTVYQNLVEIENTKETFLHVRSIDPFSVDLFTRAAYFIYLNKTCFRGLFRVNKKGGFNVPYGSYQRRYADPDNLHAVANSIQGVDIQAVDFEMALGNTKKGDFVYLDPPYYKFGGYSDFNRYTDQQFNEGDHYRLASVCYELSRKGVYWAQSNSNTPFIRSLYAEDSIIEIPARREINLNSGARNITELLITNYEVANKMQISLSE